MEKDTTIRVKVKTKEELERMGTKADTYDSIITDLIKKNKGRKK